jgi:homoserine kinase
VRPDRPRPEGPADLGPGFDVLAAALSLHVDLEVVETGTFAVQTPLDIPTDRSNLCVRAFEALHPADGFEFRIGSSIPLSGGLGTSAAAVVAGLLAADSLFELDADILGLATDLEGHPDNAAASLHGGFVVCADGQANRLDIPPGIEAVLVVPHEPVRTAAARAALPSTIPMSDAVFNISHTALLLLGVAQGDPSLIARGLRDRLHQPYRASLFPRSAQLVDDAADLGALGATISGAGPTVLVWTFMDATANVKARLQERCAGWADVMRVPFEDNGALVR